MIFVHFLVVIYYEAGENETEKNFFLLEIKENGIVGTYEVWAFETIIMAVVIIFFSARTR